jgi:hypothetical protein
VVECLSDKCEALNSNPSVAKIKEKIARKVSIFKNQILYFEISVLQNSIHKENNNVFVTNIHIVTDGILHDVGTKSPFQFSPLWWKCEP